MVFGWVGSVRLVQEGIRITQASERREKSVEFVQIVHVVHVAVTETDG
jgi:hypothetical protein